jgi:hypothetical protein
MSERQTQPSFSFCAGLHVLFETPWFRFHPAEDEQLCRLAKQQSEPGSLMVGYDLGNGFLEGGLRQNGEVKLGWPFTLPHTLLFEVAICDFNSLSHPAATEI